MQELSKRNQWYSVLISMTISFIVAIPMFSYVIFITKPSPAMMEFCSQPSNTCDGFGVLFFIGSIIFILILYFILTQVFDKIFLALQLNQEVKGN